MIRLFFTTAILMFAVTLSFNPLFALPKQSSLPSKKFAKNVNEVKDAEQCPQTYGILLNYADSSLDIEIRENGIYGKKTRIFSQSHASMDPISDDPKDGYRVVGYALEKSSIPLVNRVEKGDHYLCIYSSQSELNHVILRKDYPGHN